MALKYVDGGKSSVIIGYETGGTIVTANASMIQRAYAFNNWNVNEAEAPEENAALRDSLDPPFPEDGLLSAAGSSELPMALSGMLDDFSIGDRGCYARQHSATRIKLSSRRVQTLPILLRRTISQHAATKAARNPAVGLNLADFTLYSRMPMPTVLF